jgi:hypothetical protein
MNGDIAMFSVAAIEPSDEQREANRNRKTPANGVTWWECIVCLRPTNPDSKGVSWVLMSEHGDLYPNIVTDEEAAASEHGWMGAHPVGASCARKIPAAYKAPANPSTQGGAPNAS